MKPQGCQTVSWRLEHTGHWGPRRPPKVGAPCSLKRILIFMEYVYSHVDLPTREHTVYFSEYIYIYIKKHSIHTSAQSSESMFISMVLVWFFLYPSLHLSCAISIHNYITTCVLVSSRHLRSTSIMQRSANHTTTTR
jgi:hypothetical protein